MPRTWGKTGGAYYKSFTLTDATGNAVYADSLPTTAVLRNNVTNGSWTITCASGATTGRYTLSGTVPATFSLGDAIAVELTAIINSITTREVVDELTILPANTYDSLVLGTDQIHIKQQDVADAMLLDVNIGGAGSSSVIASLVSIYGAAISAANVNNLIEYAGIPERWRFTEESLEFAASAGDLANANTNITETKAAVVSLASIVDALKGEGWTDETLKAIKDAIAALIFTGEGAYTGILTINDGATGLEGAVVNATRGGVLIASGTTDVNGQITNWVFDAYAYTLAVRLPGYQPATSTLAVTGNAWTKTISLTALSITAPAAPTLCTVQFRVKLSDTAVAGAVCKAKLLGINQAADGTVLSNEELSDTTDAQGVAELQLVQRGAIIKGNGIYNISVEVNGKTLASVRKTIPNQSVILFEDLL